MDARPTPAAPAPPPLQASVTWANPSPSLYQFPSYTARLNENPNPNTEPFFNPSDGYYSLDYGSFKRAPRPKKGISSEDFAVHENITNCWPRNNETSLPGISGYGYGCSGWLQEYPPYYLENPYKISESLAGPVKCTTPYSESGRITNFTTSSNILKASHHVENGTMHRNISQPSIQVPSAVPDPTPSFQQSDTVLVKDSGFQFSSMPIENTKIGKFQKVPSRIGRVQPHPHKSTNSDIHKEEKVEARSAWKEVMEVKDNQRTQLEQVESAKQSLSMDGNAVQHSSSCHPHVTSASIPGDTDGEIDSSVLMAEDAPLDIILEAFRYLSGILSSSDFDASELGDHDRELLQFVMDNRRVFTVENKKDVTNNNFQDSRLKDAQSSIVRLKTDVTKLNKGSHDMEEKLLSVASNMNNDELESADHLSSSDLSIRENVAQTVEKTFQSNFSNNEESLNAQVYKKLWIDAEAALCLLKYELQLAKMKIEAENCNHQTEKLQQSPKVSSLNSMHEHAEPEVHLMAKEENPAAALPTAKLFFTEKLQQSPKVSSLNSMHEHAEPEVPLMAKEENPAAALPTAKDTEVAPIIARQSGKDQYDTPNSTWKLQQLFLDEANKMRAVHVDYDTLVVSKEKNPPAALPTAMYTEVADVMARLKVLKDRDDRPNSTNTIEQPSLDVVSDLEVRDATFLSDGYEIDTSTLKSDGKISQSLDPCVCSTDTEASSCEASIFSSEWEFELL